MGRCPRSLGRFSGCSGAGGRSSSANTIFRALVQSSPGPGWHFGRPARGCGRCRVGMRGATVLWRPPAAGRKLQVASGPERLDRDPQARGPRGPRLEAGPAGICIRERGWLAAQPRLRPLVRTPERGAEEALWRQRAVMLEGGRRCSAGPAPSLKPEKRKAADGDPGPSRKDPSASCLARLQPAELPAHARPWLSDGPARCHLSRPEHAWPCCRERSSAGSAGATAGAGPLGRGSAGRRAEPGASAPRWVGTSPSLCCLASSFPPSLLGKPARFFVVVVILPTWFFFFSNCIKKFFVTLCLCRDQ